MKLKKKNMDIKIIDQGMRNFWPHPNNTQVGQLVECMAFHINGRPRMNNKRVSVDITL